MKISSLFPELTHKEGIPKEVSLWLNGLNRQVSEEFRNIVRNFNVSTGITGNISNNPFNTIPNSKGGGTGIYEFDTVVTSSSGTKISYSTPFKQKPIMSIFRCYNTEFANIGYTITDETQNGFIITPDIDGATVVWFAIL